MTVLQRRKTIFTVVLFCLVAIASIVFIWLPLINRVFTPANVYPFTFQGALELIGAPVPFEVFNVVDNSSRGRYFAIDASFDAIPSIVHQFVAGICDGRLYQSYDPFLSITSALPNTPTAILVTADAIHYSYSPNTPSTIFGNRCKQTRPTNFQIRVDMSNSSLYSVRIASIDTPDLFPSVPVAHYETPLEAVEFPLVVVGVMQTEESYLLLGSQLCMEVRNATYWLGFEAAREQIVPHETKPYVGADIRLQIDDNELPPATVTDDGKLIAYAELENYKAWEWNYCIQAPNTLGVHQVDMIVMTQDGEISQYSWEYVVE